MILCDPHLQNTAEYLNYAHEVWTNCVKEHQFTQSVNFLSMLAIKQRQPELALEILPTDDKYFSSINLRLLALSECGQFEEAIQLTQNILSQDHYQNIKILAEVVSSNYTYAYRVCKRSFSVVI